MFQLRRPANGHPTDAPILGLLPPPLRLVPPSPAAGVEAEPVEQADPPEPVIDWQAIYAALDRWEPADQPTGEQVAAIIAAHEATRPKRIIVAGNPLDGFRLFGPVDPDSVETAEFIRRRIDTEWWFATLVPLADAANQPVAVARREGSDGDG